MFSFGNDKLKLLLKRTQGVMLSAGILAVSGCASMEVEPYRLAANAPTANVVLESSDGYFIGANTFATAENCVGHQVIQPEDSNASTPSYAVEAGKPLSMTVLVVEKDSVYDGHSCHFTLQFTPRRNATYKVTTQMDMTTKVCRSQIQESSGTAPAITLIDSMLSGFHTASAFCEGVKGEPITDLDAITTGLYRYSKAQGLSFDYTPRRLKAQ